MPLSPGTTLAHYQILGALGAGGMGEVYRARDERLGRDVALKVLHDSVAHDPRRLARFEREARTVASLNHPHIVVLHSIEEQAGVRFLTMELVEGESLAAHVAPGGLPVERLLDLAIPLADALVAAHEKGVVHRDLKPGNLMLSRTGHLKVLDFGLAKLSQPEAGVEFTRDVTADGPLSEAGTVMGTVPYMAPEQLRGEAVDARTDLFAFGVILHELATGRRPFTGTSSMDVSSAILRDPPPAITSVRSDLPPDFERIVHRCLEKPVRARYQTALDVLNELRLLRRTLEQGGAPAAVPANGGASIAILPFVNRSADPEDEYFSDGLADELMNVLVKMRGLRVAARASSFHFKGRDATIAEIGSALRVATVLDGTVRRAAGRVRVSVQLVNVADGSPLWSETYDRALDDIFAVQDDVASAVVQELRGRLLEGREDSSAAGGQVRAEVAEAVRGRVADPEAYDLYLRGRYLMGAGDEGPAQAQEMFRRAIERSPSFALAYAGLGHAYVLQSWLHSRDRGEVVTKARAALAKALELDDRLSEALVLSGQIRMYFEYDWSGAERDFRAAVELNPGSDIARREYGCFLSLVGRTAEGLEEARRAQALDPLSVNATHEVGYQLLMTGQLEEAVEEFRKAIDLNPTWIWGNIKLGMSYAFMGKAEESLACVRRADALLGERPGGPLTQAWLAGIECMAGDPGRATRTLRRLEEEARTSFVDPLALAELAYILGDYDGMFVYMERGLNLRSPAMVYTLQGRQFLWGNTAADPRFDSLIARMGFPARRA